MVCTGNHCRSPMAELLAADFSDAKSLDWQVASAGTAALIDYPAARGATKALADWGLDLSDFRGQQLSAELIDWGDHIIVMEPVQAAIAERIKPGAAAKTITLMPKGVPDPIGGSDQDFIRIRDLLAELIPKLPQMLSK